MYTTLIQAAELKALQDSGANVRVFDVSFDLMRPEQGNATYLESHLAGALHADINLVLSAKDPREAINGGRHPLPRRERFAHWLSSQGVSDETQVVVYDRNGMNYCGRLWWMLKWCGHEAVAVLDGGLQAWVAYGGAVRCGNEPTPAPWIPWPATFQARSIAPTARTSPTTEPSSPQRCCDRSSSNCWGNARQRASCITVAVGYQPSLTSWRWKLPVWGVPLCTRAAGASGAPRQGCPAPRADTCAWPDRLGSTTGRAVMRPRAQCSDCVASVTMSMPANNHTICDSVARASRRRCNCGIKSANAT